MINLILPLLKFFISLLVAMGLIAIIDRSAKDKLSTQKVAVLLAVPYLLVLLVGYFIRLDALPAKLAPYTFSFYLIIPFAIVRFAFNNPTAQAVVYSLIVLGASFFSGAAVGYFMAYFT